MEAAAPQATLKVFTELTPHDEEIKQVFPNVYIIGGSYNMGMGTLIGRTMTLYKDGNNLIIFNSLRVSEALEAEILKLGTIKHVVRMADGHGCDDAYYVDKFKPTYWSMDSFKPLPTGLLPNDETISEDNLPLPGMKLAVLESKKECTFWIPDHGGTIITADIVQNTVEIPIHASWLGENVLRFGGFLGECNCAAPVWKLIHGKKHAETAKQILSWNFENVLPGHGDAKVGGAKELCRKHFEASLGPLE